MAFSDLHPVRTEYVQPGVSWAAEFPVDTSPITLDAEAVLAKYADGVIPSGAVLARVASTGRYAPYAGTTEEVQGVSITGTPTGGTFTLTFSGQTTTGIAYNATAATVQSALEALSNIATGDVTVTGGPGPGTAFVVTFGGAYADTDVAQMTASGASLTGGSTPSVTVSTTTAGGADGGAGGTGVAAGLLLGTKRVRAGFHVPAALYYKGRVYSDRLPANSGLDANARTDLSQIRFDRVGA